MNGFISNQLVIVLNLIFFLRITILYHESSKYPIQLSQYYQMYENSKIDSFNTLT